MARILYVNAIKEEDTGECMREGIVAGLAGAAPGKPELISMNIFYGAKLSPRLMGVIARDCGASAVILSGSEKHTTNLTDPWLAEYYQGLRDLLDVPARMEDWEGPRFPVFGICFGHQSLACVLGGETARFKTRSGMEKIQALPRAYRHPVFKSILSDSTSTLELPVDHSDQVVRMPEGFHSLFNSDYCDIQGMAHDLWPIFSVQGHPEISSCMRDVPDEKEKWAPVPAAALDGHHGPVVLEHFLKWVLTR